MLQRQPLVPLSALVAAAVLAGCGGGGGSTGGIGNTAPVIEAPQVTRLDTLSTSPRGMQSIAFNGGSAYLSLSNNAAEGSAVMKTALPVAAASAWSPVALGSCAAGPSSEHMPPSAPTLKQLGDTMWLFQPWFDGPGNSAQTSALCELNAEGTGFTPRDQGLRACNEYFCSTLWMTDLKLVGNRLFTNAGAGLNVFVSDNKAANWRVLLGGFDSMVCTHSVFHVVGDRLLVGGECPLDAAYIRAYQLTADGSALVSKDELPVTLPKLDNRNVQFIESVPGTNRVFAGVEGGLLRSDDGGRTFRFVIEHPIEGAKIYPYVRAFLTPKGKPNVIVVGGFDKANAKPYLAWSADGGDKWTDISSMVPGFNRTGSESGKTSQVTSLVEDPQGRLLVTINEDEDAKGHLMLLTLGQP